MTNHRSSKNATRAIYVRLCALLISLCLLLSGCTGGSVEEEAPSSQVKVVVEEADGYTVLNNGQYTADGAPITFQIEMEEGFAVYSSDYTGYSQINNEKNPVEITFFDVRYPTRIKLQVTDNFASITYKANGGGTNEPEPKEETIVRSDLSVHKRPNTKNAGAFSREGYTLTSWNTAADGSGESVGLGSRITYEEPTTLYAMWEKWSDESLFTYTVADGMVTITDYLGHEDVIVIPERIDDKNVGTIAYAAFEDAEASRVVLPPRLETLEDGAFTNCQNLTEVVIYDSIETASDNAFWRCPNLQTLSINAIEPPYGYTYRRESCYADKVDLLILTSGSPRLVCYSGCSMWYNLDSETMVSAFPDYTIVNMGLNGTINSVVQMQILTAFLEEGDIFFHAPELAARNQLMILYNMTDADVRLWCGLENNYDLFKLVDWRTVNGVLDSLTTYLGMKDEATDYSDYYVDGEGRVYMDEWGSIPFVRTETKSKLEDSVFLYSEYLKDDNMARLERYYEAIAEKGVTIYVSYGPINTDSLPEGQVEIVDQMDEIFRSYIDAMDCATAISHLSDYLYVRTDFYDTNYHMLSSAAQMNTARWVRDLRAAMGESEVTK